MKRAVKARPRRLDGWLGEGDLRRFPLLHPLLIVIPGLDSIGANLGFYRGVFRQCLPSFPSYPDLIRVSPGEYWREDFNPKLHVARSALEWRYPDQVRV
jgi:hypothetical protein